MSFELSETYIIVGDRSSYGIERQVWMPGRQEQYVVTVPTPCPGAPMATTRTAFGSLREARAVMDAMLPYSVVYLDGRTEAAARTLGAAIALVAAAYSVDRRDVWLDDRSSDGRTVEQYEIRLRSDDEHADARAVISCDHGVEPPPGWEDRAVDRARREGVLPKA